MRIIRISPRHAEAQFRCFVLFFTVGSLKDIEQIKHDLGLAPIGQLRVLQASAGANRGIRSLANFTLATIGDLDDLR